MRAPAPLDALPALALSLWRATAALRPDVASHCIRVARLAVRLGRALDLPAPSLRALAIGALVHDAGKALVPPSILDKPAPLSPAEWALIRLHPITGEALLPALPGWAGPRHVARSHHERWDGAGYPDGLGGAAIPLLARIVAACDAYDAMTSPRPYRPALAPCAALDAIRDGAGTQFDPDVALLAPRCFALP